MSESGPDAAPSGQATTLGAMFDLTGSEAASFEQACISILSEAGLDGSGFLRRLVQAGSLGAALGLTPEVEELIYERAHRWFSVGRADRAEPLFRALCTASGHQADYWVGLGVCLRLRDDLDGAAIAVGTAAGLRPCWAVPAFHACELALRRGALDIAAAELTRFRRLKDVQTSERMAAEAERLGQAIAFRREGGMAQAAAG